jgi:uncharacterized protein
MSAGLTSRFNILQQSPHDLEPSEESFAEQAGVIRWAPSRYNVRATLEDGRLILWNTYRGSMSVFRPEQRSAIEGLLSQKGFEARSEGIVTYLHDRGFLIQAGTDEYRRIQLGFGQQHYRTDRLELILLASEDCNFRCEYCYEDFARGTMQPWVRSGVKKLLEKRLASLRSLSVLWFGGEPLYGLPAIEELAPFFLETAQANSLAFVSSMTTNGYLLTPDVADKLLSWNIRKFQITLDGAPEDHDRNRPARDGQGTFWTIFKNLQEMSRRPDPFFVDVRVNFDRGNYPRLGSFLELVDREFGNDKRFKVRFRAVGRWGGPNDPKLDICGEEEAGQVVQRLREEARRRGLNVTEDIRDVQGMGAQVCYAARPYNYIVGASGKLMKCTVDLDKHDRNVVGRITEDGDLRLDQDKMALWTEPAFEKDKKCQKCVVLPTCQGVYCPQIRIEENRSPCTPLRSSLKQEMRSVVETSGTGGRQISLGSQPAFSS